MCPVGTPVLRNKAQLIDGCISNVPMERLILEIELNLLTKHSYGMMVW
ncbi:MAG TPA: hypothetical protein VFQ56_03000 [Flavobacterium sp.]|nr:hypothetical protein [Flavobacterium sp.]